MFERFTDRSRRVVVLAQEEARMMAHNYIGTEHLLLGLIHEREGVAAKTIDSFGITLDQARDQLEEIIGRGQQEPSGHIPFTPRSKKVLELSLREAAQLGHPYIGTEHLLLGLVAEGDGVAVQILVKLGANLRDIRQRVIDMLTGAYSGPRTSTEAAASVPDTPLGHWGAAHAASITRPAGSDPAPAAAGIELRAAVSGLPLLARAGLVLPLALLLDLVRLTGGLLPADPRLRALAGQPGVARLRSLGWPPAARVALAGLLACDLPADAEWALPDASPLELREALEAALPRGAGSPARTGALREYNEKIAEIRRLKEDAIDERDFEKAAGLRDVEKQWLALKAARDKEITARAASRRELLMPVGDGPGWQASGAIGEALSAAAAQVSDMTVAMLEILGAAAAAAEPTLPLKMRHRIASLPRLGARDRRLIMEAVAVSPQRSDVTAAAFDATMGTTGISRRGKLTGLLPGQLALPADLLEYRQAGRELLYRVSEAETQAPPETVTLILDTTPATFGPPEVVLRLVAHVIAVTLWTMHRAPALVTLDRPALTRPLAAPADLVALWTARSLEPPDFKVALAAAQRLGAPAVVLTERHAAQDLGLIPHRGLRLLTTHVADDAPPPAPRGPFHVHLPPSPTSAQVVKAVQDLIDVRAARKAG